MSALTLAAVLAQVDPVWDALGYLVRHQAPGGSWDQRATHCHCRENPIRAGTTGLALFTFLRVGYSPLSKDLLEGREIGKLMKEGFSWVLSRQRDDGLFFPEDPTSNAWMALALAELYSLTGMKPWEQSARRAAEAIQGMPAVDDDTRFWQSWVLELARADALIPKSPDSWEPLPEAALMDAELAQATPQEILSMDVSLLKRRHSRREHDAWRKRVWAGQLKEGCGAGSWRDSVEATSARAGMLGWRCWPCRNVFQKD